MSSTDPYQTILDSLTFAEGEAKKVNQMKQSANMLLDQLVSDGRQAGKDVDDIEKLQVDFNMMTKKAENGEMDKFSFLQEMDKKMDIIKEKYAK
jgi:hypothetical protein